MNSENLKEQLYEDMYLIRKTEEKLLELFSQGELFGTIHTSLGQEAIAVGILNNIDIKKDCVFSNHRCHGHYLAVFKDSKELLSEIMGKETGMCAGIGGSQHVQKENFFSNGILAGMSPVAAGSSFAQKMWGREGIVVLFIGDGALGEGVVYETLNIISLLQLPILIVIENNQYAQSTPIRLNLAGSIRKRIEAFGIENKEMKTNNVFDIYETSKEIIKNIRERRTPFALIMHTYRLGPHSKGDDNRDPKEIEKYRTNDPLLIIKNFMDENKRGEIEKKIEEKINQAVSFARNSKVLSKEEFVKRIYER